MVSESKLTLDILPLSADTARLVRVYGTEPCIALPGTLPAPEGGSFAVTELGDYCFSSVFLPCYVRIFYALQGFAVGLY